MIPKELGQTIRAFAHFPAKVQDIIRVSAREIGIPLYAQTARAFASVCEDSVTSSGRLRSMYTHAKRGCDKSLMVFNAHFNMFSVLIFSCEPPCDVYVELYKGHHKRPNILSCLTVIPEQPIVIPPQQHYRIVCSPLFQKRAPASASSTPSRPRSRRRGLFTHRRRSSSRLPKAKLRYVVCCVETPIIFGTETQGRFWDSYGGEHHPRTSNAKLFWMVNDQCRLAKHLMKQFEADTSRFYALLNGIYRNYDIAPHRETPASTTKAKWDSIFDAVSAQQDTLQLYASSLIDDICKTQGRPDGEESERLAKWIHLLLIAMCHAGEKGFTDKSKIKRKMKRLRQLREEKQQHAR